MRSCSEILGRIIRQALILVLAFSSTAQALAHAYGFRNSTNSKAKEAAQELRGTCSDDYSLRVLALWFNTLPFESQTSITDPVIRRAASRANEDNPEVLGGAAQRIVLLAAAAAAAGRIGSEEMERELTKLRREFPSLKFPGSLEEALEGNDKAATLYLMATLDVLRRAPFGDCSAVFRRFMIQQDERVQFVPVYRATISVEGVQQWRPGTQGPVFDAPTRGCQLVPSPPRFFDVLASGRVAGKFSALGFPEAVAISLQMGQGEPWSCSGVLLSPRWALTAAHCLEDGSRSADTDRILVMLNEKVAGLSPASIAPNRARLSGPPILHPDFRQAVMQNRPREMLGSVDLALLPLALSLEVPEARAWRQPELPPDLLGTLAGYGATAAESAAAEANPPLNVGWLKLQSTAALIKWSADLGGGGAAENASCPGDSGAPIYATLEANVLAPDRPGVGCLAERRVLIGLVSYGESLQNRSCLAASRGAGPRLLPHWPWICQHTGLGCN